MIVDEVKSQLEEIDIEGMVKADRIKKMVEAEVKDAIWNEVSKRIENSMFKALNKEFPIIDAWIAGKVQGILLEINKS